jgi:hypothetical protein
MTDRLKVNGIMRDGEDPRALVLYLSREPTGDELRAIHDAARAFGLMPAGPPDLQARYDILAREVERERSRCARLQADLYAAMEENAKLRQALGLKHYAPPAPARNFGGG